MFLKCIGFILVFIWCTESNANESDASKLVEILYAGGLGSDHIKPKIIERLNKKYSQHQDVVQVWAKKYLDDKVFKKIFSAIVSEEYLEQDIKYLLEFYQTDLGMKSLEVRKSLKGRAPMAIEAGRSIRKWFKESVENGLIYAPWYDDSENTIDDSELQFAYISYYEHNFTEKEVAMILAFSHTEQGRRITNSRSVFIDRGSKEMMSYLIESTKLLKELVDSDK